MKIWKIWEIMALLSKYDGQMEVGGIAIQYDSDSGEADTYELTDIEPLEDEKGEARLFFLADLTKTEDESIEGDDQEPKAKAK